MSPSSLRSWIRGCQPQRLTIRLIQCDLARHSAWFRKCVDEGFGEDATAAKQRFAEAVLQSLVGLGFDQVSWRGDGGLYAAREVDITGAQVIEAAHATREEFLQWQQSGRSELRLEDLALRISCHSCPVWIGPNPEYWSSDGLNLFCKNERTLSHENTIAITHEIFTEAGRYADQFRKCSRRVTVGDIDPQEWKVYYDETIGLAKALAATTTSFRKAFSAGHCQDVAASSQRFAIGDSVVLHMVSSPEDTLDIDLEHLSAQGFGELEKLPKWHQLETEIKHEIEKTEDPRKRVDWEKAAPLKLRLPLKDFPVAKIEYQPVMYSKARSFITLIEEDQKLWRDLASRGADYDEGMPNRPGLLVCHMVVIAHDGNGRPCVILAQRSTRQKPNVGFALGRWSASIEEQFTTSDATLNMTVKRGLKEELLGQAFDKATVSFAALFLERAILNLAVATVCRTGLSIAEVHELWMDCEDRDEHSQVVALPLDNSLLKECIRNGVMTEDARSRCIVLDHNTWKITRGWELHRSSPFRLALALWASGNL